jgi:uncharacterized membrane protein YphA (DoxX/SURF4 family)
MCAVGVLMIAAGALLLIGFLTRFAALVGALTIVTTIMPWLPSPDVNLLQMRVTEGLLIAIALSLACLGPGAFSLDGRLFGRREILIPPSSSDTSTIS